MHLHFRSCFAKLTVFLW